jgi:hypothetical protein
MMHEQLANVRVRLHCTPVYKPCHTLVLGLFCNLQSTSSGYSSLVSQSCVVVNSEFTAADQAEAFAALTAKREQEAALEIKRAVLSKRILHQSVWLAMRPEDRQVFAEMSDKFEADGKISLRLLCDKKRPLLPGHGSCDRSVHELLNVQNGLASFANGVNVTKAEKLSVVSSFLARLNEDSTVPEASKVGLVDAQDALSELQSAMDLRLHVPSLDVDNL